jgi:hypothetical protein
VAAEPRILTEDVRTVLRRVVHPDDPDYGESVQQLADRAGTSTRTVYRVLSGQAGRRRTGPAAISLGLGDSLLVAAGATLAEVRLLYADGTIEWGP